MTLPVPRFLNMVYASMCSAMITIGEDGQVNDHREEIDRSLDVADWGSRVKPRVDRPKGVPSWWQGDEEASQSFLASMGVVLE